MRRRLAAGLSLGGILASLAALTSPLAASYSDGIAGSSGAVPEHLRDCAGAPPCIVEMPLCGGCHGAYKDMQRQEGAQPTPQDRLRPVLLIDGDAETDRYEPDRTYTVEIRLESERAFGRYNSGGFNLNVSAGRLAKTFPGDDTVRITQGLFQHAGTKNQSYWSGEYRYGRTQEDESGWAGEATHTARGAERRSWRVQWTAPTSQPPHGVAFVMSAMVPNGDGINTCVYQIDEAGQCNATRGYRPQAEWDWFGFLIPRRILIENDWHRENCTAAVLRHILPPRPTPADPSPTPEPVCERVATPPISEGEGVPDVGPAVLVALTAVAFLRHRWSRRTHR